MKIFFRLIQRRKKGDRNASIHGDRGWNDRGKGPRKTGDRS